ncbi:nucleoside phosphatase family-domain-containing protein [Lipomyces tetrasporus]|uniref:Nucleoside phosphatase family-domain-containing protein n=1 Tax=Lipomyces tetrasporus TaxID=54092 RepID=A0AAD7QKE8_9ASCO|nr:nucleoside phosphatase family-domain-containing protein [Lipomyces tetrasporus]KAJ8096874.1 nucleoside phosphatase family-domain-containing protein [Lipomyces tetrasporus]
MPSIQTKVTSYGIVIDAGSSGSRVQIYSWPSTFTSKSTLPKVGKGGDHWHKKVKPGISSYNTHIDDLAESHLEPLIDHAKTIIPPEKHAETPIFLYATAGMRLLSPGDQQKLLSRTCQYIVRQSNFLLTDCDAHVKVIDGETEGLYGWLALNYMMGSLDSPDKHNHGKGHHTYGFLDMGGASAQVAFAPNSTEAEKHMDDLYSVRLRTQAGEPREFSVFVSTWLGYGANEAHRRYFELLVEEADAKYSLGKTENLDSDERGIIIDPCSPNGYLEDDEPLLGGRTLKGTGNLTECLAKTYPLLSKTLPCNDDPCLFGGVHAPNIDFDVNHFIGVSEYWHTMKSKLFADVVPAGGSDAELDGAAGAGAYDYATFSKKVQAFCARDWSELETAKDTKDIDEDQLKILCFKGSWVMNVLHSGFGVPRTSALTASTTGTDKVVEAATSKGFVDHFKSVDTINGVELSWTLGKMVLYASSEVPLAPTLASVNSSQSLVGYGPNNGNFIPEKLDIGKVVPVIPENDDDSDGWWDDYGFNITTISAQSTLSQRRLPGLLMFAAIFVAMAYVLIGKVRRRKLTFTLTPKRYRRRVFGANTPTRLESGVNLVANAATPV